MTDYYNALSPFAERQAPVTPPEDASPATPPELLSGALPHDLRILLPLLTRLDNTEGRTGEEEIARRQRFAEVRKLVFALQQGPQAPEFTADTQAQAGRAQENSLATRTERIAQLRKALNR